MRFHLVLPAAYRARHILPIVQSRVTGDQRLPPRQVYSRIAAAGPRGGGARHIDRKMALF
jgi:hypothetical protein